MGEAAPTNAGAGTRAGAHGSGRACCRGARRGAVAGVIAKALTLLLLGVGIGAYHSIREPVTLRMAAVETTTVRLPGAANPTGDQPPVEGEGNGETPDGSNAQVPDPSVPTPDPAVKPPVDPVPNPVPDAGGEELVLGQFINLDTARKLWEVGAAEFIDARHLDEYAAGHIPRAHLYDPRRMYEAETPDWVNWFDYETTILVVYCDGGQCDASQNAVRQLQGMGFKRLHIMEEGFPAWKAAGIGVDIGEPGATHPAPQP